MDHLTLREKKTYLKMSHELEKSFSSDECFLDGKKIKNIKATARWAIFFTFCPQDWSL